jgi:hypothetical protein
MKKEPTKESIVDTAKCHQDEHGIYCVESPKLDILLGAAETEGRAWQIFFELLDDLWREYQGGNLAVFQTTAAKMLGRKGGIARTKAKREAARANGAKGGRPRRISGAK